MHRNISEQPSRRLHAENKRIIRLDGLPEQPYNLEVAPPQDSGEWELKLLPARPPDQLVETPVAHLEADELYLLQEYLTGDSNEDFESKSGILFRRFSLPAEEAGGEIKKGVTIRMKGQGGQAVISQFSAEGLNIVLGGSTPRPEDTSPKRF